MITPLSKILPELTKKKLFNRVIDYRNGKDLRKSNFNLILKKIKPRFREVNS